MSNEDSLRSFQDYIERQMQDPKFREWMEYERKRGRALIDWIERHSWVRLLPTGIADYVLRWWDRRWEKKHPPPEE